VGQVEDPPPIRRDPEYRPDLGLRYGVTRLTRYESSGIRCDTSAQLFGAVRTTEVDTLEMAFLCAFCASNNTPDTKESQETSSASKLVDGRVSRPLGELTMMISGCGMGGRTDGLLIYAAQDWASWQLVKS